MQDHHAPVAGRVRRGRRLRGPGPTPALPVLGPQTVGTTFAGVITDPFSVGQGLSAASLVANDGSSTVNKPLFAGDSRPAQVIFREGFFFEARTIHPETTGSPVA